jgi:diguanylate cyclase (GGDEF)-like protein
VGDRVLATVAERLEEVVREADSVSRVGGDEFIVVVEGAVDSEDLAALCERIVAAVTAPVEVEPGVAERVGISIGVALAGPGVDVDPDRLLSAADTAMYRAKAHGGDGYRITRLER